MVFPVVIYECESWTTKKAEHQRTDTFELWCWRRLLNQKAGGEGDDRGQDGWISSPTQWTWVWASSRRWTAKDVWLLMLCLTLCHSMDYSMPGFSAFTISQSLLKLMSIELVIMSNHLVLCCPLLLPPSIFTSIMVFSKKSVFHIRWPKYWSFSFSISPSNEYSGMISFRIDWFDLLAVQGTLKSLLQHYSSEASVFQCSVFFMVQLSYPYMTIEKTTALTRQTFVSK